MIKVVISGYGKMGRMVDKILEEKGIECVGRSEDIVSFDRAAAKDCVCIDFTFPESFRANYRFLADSFKAVVVGTTGWYDIKDEVFAYFREKGTPLVWASNFSIGVNVLSAAVDMVSTHLGKTGGYTPYIIEKHHCHKLDAPSGTALTLASEIERHIPGEVQTLSVRAGEIPGVHTVTFEGLGDRITLEHEAFSRRGLAEGAVTAAMMTEGLEGVHEFKDLMFSAPDASGAEK
jgi:4-hydroxy-tetrahydrodipicolinate reductase